jgi:hypothetical protein
LGIPTPKGHAGTGPTLSLVYSSGAGAGVCGVGWSFGVGAIRRRTDKGIPSFQDDDRFVLGDDELVPLGDGYFRRRTEGSFARIRHVHRGNQDFWAVTTRAGHRSIYGRSASARNGSTGKVVDWLLEETRDPNDNAVTYTWERAEADGKTYLTQIDWGSGAFRAVLTYEARPDVLRDARSGHVITTSRRLRRVDIQAKRTTDGVYATFERTDLAYELSSITGLSLLTQVLRTGFDEAGASRTFPPTLLSYQAPSEASRPERLPTTPGKALSEQGVQLVDLNGNGLPDLLESSDTGARVWRNQGGGRFAPPRSIRAPRSPLSGTGVFLSDMSGTGFADWVTPRGVFPNVYGAFGQLRPWRRAPATPLQSADARLVDLNGDGVGDVLVTRGPSVEVYVNTPGEGFNATPLVLPARPGLPALSNRFTRLADMTGDGFVDLVRLTRGTLEVFQGLGMGRFEAPRRMPLPEALPAGTEPEHMLLADVTGTGAADLVVLLPVSALM